jgi:hypothetical protein
MYYLIEHSYGGIVHTAKITGLQYQISASRIMINIHNKKCPKSCQFIPFPCVTLCLLFALIEVPI